MEFEYKGHTIKYQSQGSLGTPMVCVHGASSDRRIWNSMLNLAGNQRIITLDLLGHGESDQPEGIEYDDTLWANSTEALLDKIGIEKAVFVTHSYGVVIMKRFYSLFPERVSAWVLLDGKVNMALSKGVHEWMTQTLQRSDYTEFMKNLQASHKDPFLSEAAQDLVAQGAVTTPSYVLKGQLHSLLKNHLYDIHIEVPVLAVYRNNTCDWTEGDEVYLKEHTQDLELHVMDETSHFMMLHQPTAVWGLIEKFIKRHPSL
ncbi:alpha/beta hydrolase [Aureisphaera galaxeae]|uniref:alpha/beta fold hydrolase n=1 Tax=Aureisphaera galaxeae TaxID=1538023 RepID=UPI00234FD9AF|nr:alpha/beta hydrolase [Aureisphaera galaxeae]MDC8004153.1 alpha/beta hydrolase [Aureisphaera galaxeae]